MQYLRTLERKTRAEQTFQKLLDEIAKSEGVTDWKMRLTKEGKTGMHLGIMESFGLIAKVLGQMGVMVLSNATKIPLWTSDNPASLHNEFGQFSGGNLGLLSIGIEMCIPLSPTVKIEFFDPVTYRKESFSEMIPMKEADVIHSNHLQTRGSTRFMY